MRLDNLFHNRQAKTLAATFLRVGYEFFEDFIEKIRRNAYAGVLHPASSVPLFRAFRAYSDLTSLCVLYCVRKQILKNLVQKNRICEYNEVRWSDIHNS